MNTDRKKFSFASGLGLLALAASLAIGLPAQSQTATNVVNLPTNNPATPFINQLGAWVTSYNTNLVWTNEFAIDTGVATTTGQKVADKLEFIDNIGSFEAGASGQFTGTGSAFNEAEAVVGYDLVKKYDFRLAVELGGGYDWNATDGSGKKVGAFVIDPALAAYKKITQITFATIKYDFPVESVGKFDNVGTIYVGAGFTF